MDVLDETGKKLGESAISPLVTKEETQLELCTGSRWGGGNFLFPSCDRLSKDESLINQSWKTFMLQQFYLLHLKPKCAS